MNDEIIEWHAIFGGRVQGVGFRASALYIAEDLGINGTVCNLPDGTVELNAQGSSQAIRALLESLQNEFPGLKVVSQEQKTPGWLFSNFRITYPK